MDQTEEWKQYEPVPCYWVSNLGRVKRLYKNGNEKHLKPCVSYKGYLWIDLVRLPKRIRGNIHVMVATCFIENPENKPHVDHINENKSDNRVSNLRWATDSENQHNITKLRTSNTSGCVGVHLIKYTYKGVIYERWKVRVGVDKKRIYIGSFVHYDEAVEARREAEKKYFGEFCPER